MGDMGAILRNLRVVKWRTSGMCFVVVWMW
jgi:hypothetical protein